MFYLNKQYILKFIEWLARIDKEDFKFHDSCFVF